MLLLRLFVGATSVATLFVGRAKSKAFDRHGRSQALALEPYSRAKASRPKSPPQTSKASRLKPLPQGASTQAHLHPLHDAPRNSRPLSNHPTRITNFADSGAAGRAGPIRMINIQAFRRVPGGARPYQR